VDLATTISFLIAPFVAVANYSLVTKHIDKSMQPKKWLRLLAIIGILYLVGFSLLFLYLRIF
jgi:Mn2+/Fe2+ NRAMP family transporter